MKLSDLRPLRDWILVKKNFKTGSLSKGGIIIKHTKEERPLDGWVVSIGNDVIDVKIGDHIHFPFAAGTTFEHLGEKVSIIREKDLNGIMTDD